jgi:predicted ATPase
MCDGVYLVELASIRAPELVLPTIAAVLGVRERRRDNLAQLLADYLVDRRLMLILDNFEHLLAAASVVAMLLAVCPQLKVVVTSRARLRLYGEHEVVVPPLPLPDPGDLVGAAESAAVRLFCARAQGCTCRFLSHALADAHGGRGLSPSEWLAARHRACGRSDQALFPAGTVAPAGSSIARRCARSDRIGAASARTRTCDHFELWLAFPVAADTAGAACCVRRRFQPGCGAGHLWRAPTGTNR